MSPVSRLTFILLSLAIIGAATTALRADESKKSDLRVSATILPHVRSRLEREPESLTITEEDRRRGSVAISGVRLVVQTNDPSGFIVVFRLRGAELVKSMRVEGMSREVVANDGTGFVLQPFSGTAEAVSQLEYRLTLKPGVAPGTYRWPVSTEVRQISGMP